ncbi:FAD/NAD-P-binding domain-containing protein [Amylostereum chailletii]|nr:FAD/NAD-P-binding domain-containing protein [Amylostereum chailletii]
MVPTPTVLVVGAGPSGLVAALTLRRNGVPVRLIDRRTIYHGAIRGTSIQPRTLELLELLGVLKDVLDISTPPYTMAIHGTGHEVVSDIQWADEADPSPGIPYAGPINLHQSTFEEVLRKSVEKLGVTIELGVELLGYEQDVDAEGAVGGDSVGVRLRLPAGEEVREEFEYVVAADGARGSTRRMLGLEFLGETKETDRMLVANTECTDIDREHWHRWGQFGKLVFFLKPVPPAPTFQIQSLGPDLPSPLPPDNDAIQKLFNAVSQSSNIQLRNSSWMSEWRANMRMVSRFSVGRVYLVGDSAHCHSPTGGQGTNTGITDAFNLTWKIALVHHKLSPPSLLESYASERMPVVAEMLNLTAQLHALAFHAPRRGAMPPSTLDARGAVQASADPMFRPKHVLQLGVNYRWSSIVREGREADGARDATAEHSPYGVAGSRLRAGDRAPDAPALVEGEGGRARRLFELIRGGSKHAILVFTSSVAPLPALDRYCRLGVASVVVLHPQGAASHPAHVGEDVRCFVDTAGHAYAGYEVEGRATMFVVVRPDGMIGAYATGVE